MSFVFVPERLAGTMQQRMRLEQKNRRKKQPNILVMTIA
jgi:hypothetical protein